MPRIPALTSTVFLAVALLHFPPRAPAQTLVITACKDSTGAGMGKNSRPILHKALRRQKIRLIEYSKYLVETHPEPEVFRYMLEAIMEADPPDEPGFSEENKGLAFLHLKIVLDAFVSSLPPGPRPRLDA